MLIKKISYSLLALVAGSVMLTACNKYVAATDKKIETTLERTEDYLEQSQIPDLPEPTDTVRIQNDIWLGNQSVKIMEGDPLPSVFEKEDGVTIAIAEDAKLTDVLQQITDLTDIPVQLDDLKEENAVPEDAVPVRYSGKLSGLLNYLSNRYGVYWRYKDRMITFFTKETRVFTIYALPTETSINASLQGATLGEGGGGNVSSSLSTSADLKLWDNIEEGFKQVAGEQATLSFSHATGTISVTASPYIIRKVATYIASWNERLSRQVAITVRIFQVSLSNNDNYGLDLTAAFKTKRHELAFSTFAGAATGGTGLASTLTMGILKGNWTGTQPIISALSSQGKTRVLNTASVTTLNNRVAPIQVTTSQNYVKEITVTRSGSSDNQSTDVDTETDTLNYGFTMDVLPRILDHGRLILLFSMSITELVGMDSVNSGSSSSSDSSGNQNDEDSSDNESESSTIQLPTMTMRGFVQEVAMRSGNTLVLTGFERIVDETKNAGIGRAQMGLLGGQAYNNNDRQVLVILITPEVLQSPLSQEALMRNY